MSLLAKITSPADLRKLSRAQLDELASEIREFLVQSVSKTGGHLGPNLGVVELTIALHRVFASPKDTIVFDTGHQSYVHKLLTGRKDFSRLRKADGLAGYPSREESVHDVVENSHASTALSWAEGIAKGYRVLGQTDRHVVGVIGDGALTGGMAWEALNNIATNNNRNLVVVVNDNERSYDPTIGGVADRLALLRTKRGYEEFLGWGKRTLHRGGTPGRMTYSALRGMKKGLKDFIAPQGLFEDLGLKYLGPVNGHDVEAVERALRRAREYDGPVIVHAVTQKGRGYTPAEQDVADRFHAVGQIHPETGLPIVASRFGWTKVFGDEIVQIARKRPDIVAITAAMLQPVGLTKFAAEFPDRLYDVGIAEQHAVTSAAGLAFAGAHPVFAVYSTFLNRAYDQVLMDVALHKAGVTFVLDRAGITGDDGPSHNGMWDMALLRTVPGLRLAAPRDEKTLRQALREAVDVDDGPTVLRYAKGSLPEPLPALESQGAVDILARPKNENAAKRVLIVGIGAMAHTALEVHEQLAEHEITSTVVDPRWILPVPEQLTALAAAHEHLVMIEDGLVEGGMGDAIAQNLNQAGLDIPWQAFGIPQEFLSHASRNEIVAQKGLEPLSIANAIVARITADSTFKRANVGDITS
ncbi:MAG TPA: 1-deoxy-D-xylulose-5-phosphate synthase [Actinomycetales bacterium]|nr:1-deoxy-D-xylulose-5-phosphate synthase [Actinomycetales bacterium]